MKRSSPQTGLEPGTAKSVGQRQYLSCFNLSSQQYTDGGWMISDLTLWPFKTSSVVRLWRESSAGPLTHKASPNQPTESFGGPVSHEKGV